MQQAKYTIEQELEAFKAWAKDATEILQQGCELMTPEQCGQWQGIGFILSINPLDEQGLAGWIEGLATEARHAE